MHNKEAGVYDTLAGDGDVVEHILRSFHTGGGVDVAAEFRTDALKVLEHLLAGKVLEAVEAHMLKEVCKTVLIGLFLDCANVGCQIELCPLCGLVVVTDVVGKTVVQFAHAGFGIVGQGSLSA